MSAHLDAVNTSDLVYLSGISIAVLDQAGRNRLWQALAHRGANGLQVAFDSNYRPKLWDTHDLAHVQSPIDYEMQVPQWGPLNVGLMGQYPLMKMKPGPPTILRSISWTRLVLATASMVRISLQ